MSKDELFRQIASIIGGYFNVDPSSIRPETISDDVHGWDSVSYAGLLIQIEDQFGVEIDADVAWDFSNVGQMADYIFQALIGKSS